MTTIYYTRCFTDGLLAGCLHHDKVDYPTPEECAKHIYVGKTVRKSRFTDSYRIVDASFQNYAR